MILEVATLNVTSGREAEFEGAFGEAKSLLFGFPGFIELELYRTIEFPNKYILLARWRKIEDHTEGFRGSAQFARWRELLQGFWDSLPEVVHCNPVAEMRPDAP
jgi:heme-degrading monooxygenase HmoA